MKTICFTGHRNLIISAEIKKRLYSLLERLIQSGADTFISGGACGFDMLCGEAVLFLREKKSGH